MSMTAEGERLRGSTGGSHFRIDKGQFAMLGKRFGGNRDEATAAGSPVRARRRSASETWAWIMVAAGVILRILEYSDNRPLYRDEMDLRKNLVGIPFYDFRTPLVEQQLAAPGFLAVERLMILLPLPFLPKARFVPFICSIASMFLIKSVARRYLAATAVPIAVGLFALTDWLLYYSVELKQYSSDVALTLTALLLAAEVARSPKDGGPAKSRRDFFLLGAFGAIGVWFSHPLALVLAGAGTYLILNAVSRRDWRRAVDYAAMSLLWALSFAGCFQISQRIVSKDGFLETWWAFAFLPFPPRSLAEFKQVFWQLINVFDAPSGLATPLGTLPSAFIAAGLFLLGAWSLWRSWRGGFFLLVSPILFALIASVLHRYPFHGRLLLFLVPSVHLLVGEGADALTRKGGAKLTFALAAFLLAQPFLDVSSHRFVMKRHHMGYDSHGDLHPDVLDYLERREKWKLRDEMMQRIRADRLEAEARLRAEGQAPTAAP